MLIFNSHTLYISSQAIQFYIEHKIILLCEAPYTSYICQPYNCGVFLPLSIEIKLGIQSRYRFNPYYAINKSDFLKIYQEARTKAIMPENIQKAWANTGLYPFNLDIVLSQIPKAPSTSTNRPTTPLTIPETIYKCFKTPADIKAV